MNWEAVGAIAEAIGVIAILVSLVYVAVQIRHLSVGHSPIEFEGSARGIDEILVTRGVQEWLQFNSPDWRPAFRTFVDDRLARIKQQT